MGLPPGVDEETFSLLERVGRVPLPPYIRKGEMRPEDRQNYQTVYAADARRRRRPDRRPAFHCQAAGTIGSRRESRSAA